MVENKVGITFEVQGSEIISLLLDRIMKVEKEIVESQQRLDILIGMAPTEEVDNYRREIIHRKEEIEGIRFLSTHVNSMTLFHLTAAQVRDFGVTIPFNLCRE